VLRQTDSSAPFGEPEDIRDFQRPQAGCNGAKLTHAISNASVAGVASPGNTQAMTARPLSLPHRAQRPYHAGH
jgi:hypothetical protein